MIQRNSFASRFIGFVLIVKEYLFKYKDFFFFHKILLRFLILFGLAIVSKYPGYLVKIRFVFAFA